MTIDHNMKYVMLSDERIEYLQHDDNLENLENNMGVDVDIDLDAKTVKVESQNSVKKHDATRVLRAIACGFDIKNALKLYRSEIVYLETIDIKNHTRNKDEQYRQKGRIIGKDGRAKELIEELSGANVNIYKNQIGILGDLQDVKAARRAVLMFLDGSPHSSVYNYLEKYQGQKNKIKL